MRDGGAATASADSPGESRVRLAVFTSHPIQYNASLFRALAREQGLDPTVFYGSRHGLDPYRDSGFQKTLAWDIPLLDGYEHIFLENRPPRPDPSSYLGVVVPEIRRHWTRGSFDAALLLGWYTLGHLQALQAAWAAGIPVIVRGESTLERGPRSRPLWQLQRRLWKPLRRPLYRWVFSRVDAFLTIGSRNETFYRHFGVPSSKLVRAGYSSDNRRFALPSEERQRARTTIRSLLGFGSEATIFLFVGKLADYKRPMDLLSAFLATAAEHSSAALLFVGDGPLQAELAREVASSGMEQRVRFAGFVNQRQLPAWYAAADCLVLPSDATETWGLVVNEAMASGLPVIVSWAVGCAPDLVRDGENGWTYSAGDESELRLLLRHFLSLPRSIQAAMGQRSREVVAHWTPEAVAERCSELIQRVAGLGAPSSQVESAAFNQRVTPPNQAGTRVN